VERVPSRGREGAKRSRAHPFDDPPLAGHPCMQAERERGAWLVAPLGRVRAWDSGIEPPSRALKPCATSEKWARLASNQPRTPYLRFVLRELRLGTRSLLGLWEEGGCAYKPGKEDGGEPRSPPPSEAIVLRVDEVAVKLDLHQNVSRSPA
jgi:hypothetical protein